MKKNFLFAVAIAAIILAIVISVSYIKNTPYREIKSALNSEVFTSEWAVNNGYKYDVNSQKGMEIVAEKLESYRNENDAESAIKVIIELLELGIEFDGKYYYFSSGYINWLKDNIQSNGSGSTSGKEYAYTSYGYKFKWNPSMMMNQIYINVNGSWRIITVNNSYYKIPSSDKVGIG